MPEIFVDQALAGRLVEAISQVIPYHINLMDPAGVIIASTDRHRIGSVHMGGKQLMESGASQLIVEFDGQYAGCRQGLNLPICVRGSTLGVVGITGPVQEVVSYGQILRLLLEVMLENNYLSTQSHLDEKARQLFLQRWISREYGDPPEVFRSRVQQLGFFPAGQYTALVLTVAGEGELENAVAVYEQVANQIRRQAPRRDNLVTWMEGRIVWVTTESDGAKTMEQLQDLFRWAQAELGVGLLCGIGESCHSYRQVAQSFWQARRALQVAEPVGGIAAYRDHLLEIAFGEIPPAVQEAVYRHTFGGCFPQEVREICRFLEIYCRNNGSINRMAQELFIHKNTVQYRITKLHEKLGLDLRNLNDLLQLQFAALIAGRLAGEEPQIPLEGGER